jgi:hypothetical protein
MAAMAGDQQGRVDDASATATLVFAVDMRTFARPLVRGGPKLIGTVRSGDRFEGVQS